MAIIQSYKQHFIWFVLVYLSMYILHSTDCTDLCVDTTTLSPVTQYDTRIQANVIYIQELSSIRDCIKQCSVRTDCNVLSYHKDILVCELGRNANDVRPSPDFMTIDMTNWIPSMDITGVCTGHQCIAGHMCVPKTRGGHQCIPEDSGYTSDNRFVNNLPAGTSDVTATSYKECLHGCQTRNCSSFFFGNGQCKEFSSRLFSDINAVPVPGWRYYERTRSLGNLALGKPTTQSSVEGTTTAADLSAASTVDGNRYTTTYSVGRSCFISMYEDNPWMAVDLVDAYFIQEVAIQVRRGGDPSFEMVTASYGLAIGTENTCGVFTGIAATEAPINMICSSVQQGRYVRLRSAVTGKRFSVCELEIYGYL